MTSPGEQTSPAQKGGFFSGLMDRGKHAAAQMQSMANTQAERYRPEDPASYDSTGAGHSGLPTSFHELRNQAAGIFPRQSPHTLKLQKAIISQKGCTTEMNDAGKAQKVMATQLYQWTSESQPPVKQQAVDIEDVGDRLAWVLWKQGELQQDYATKMEQARVALKDVRNFEAKLQPQRDLRLDTKNRISKLTEKKAEESKITAAEHELTRLEATDKDNEMSVLALKRQKLKEAFTIEFSAMRQLGEQMSVLGSYGELLLDCFQHPEPGHPPKPYIDFQRTLHIREECDKALAAYNKDYPLIPKPSLPEPGPHVARSNSTVSSFGQTHQGDMAALAAASHQPTPAMSPSVAAVPPPMSSVASPPLVSQLNTAPVSSVLSPVAAAGPSISSPQQPPVQAAAGAPVSPNEGSRVMYPASPTPAAAPDPTVAETGVPTSGTNGPSSGQLKPRRPSAAASTALPPPAGNVAEQPPVLPPREQSKEQEWRDEVERNWQAAQGSSGLTRGESSATRQTGPPAYSTEEQAEQGQGYPAEKPQ